MSDDQIQQYGNYETDNLPTNDIGSDALVSLSNIIAYTSFIDMLLGEENLDYVKLNECLNRIKSSTEDAQVIVKALRRFHLENS